MKIKECDELGIKFPIDEDREKKPTLIGFIKFIKYRLFLLLPVRKKELYDYLYYTSQLVKAVKELEAINRTQITGMLYQINNLKTDKEETTKSKNENKYRSGMYE